jgi:DNA processing protein
MAARNYRHWARERRLWWLLWSGCPGIGSVRLQALDRAFVSLAAAWRAPWEAFARLPGWHAGLEEPLTSYRRRWGEDPLPAWSRHCAGGVGVLLPGDASWPPAMKHLARPPVALYWKGRGSLWASLQIPQAVAVVGTRRASDHGLFMARQLGAVLAEAGWPVVSGLAEGIDGAVHRGCLEAGGVPVGVLGTPLERVYPSHHVSLQAQVGTQGLLISELPPGCRVQAGHFASRNRLLVGLAAALVVVECPERSGALLSADLAWKHELPIWVVPADAAKTSAMGSNRLLVRGATPLLTPDDLIASLGEGPFKSPGRALPSSAVASCRPLGSATSMAIKRQALLGALGSGSSLDQLSLDLGWSCQDITTSLLELEMAGLVLAQPGLRWRLR